MGFTPPGWNHGKPKEQSGGEKGSVFDVVPQLGSKSYLEYGGNMPNYENSSRCEPAE